MATDSVTWVRQFVCGLHGHDSLMQFERGRLSLKCTSCGHESPGWDLRRQQATETAAAAGPERRRRFLPQLVAARRMVLGH
ncbi:MAG TPA: hypothetical protein VM032_12180 [Vicinamibacterales bacterium]|nr:hypothetical protein [Vicinamibacterales bacterium]